MDRQIKFRMWNGVSKRYHYDIENVFGCIEQQVMFDKSMESRGLTIGYNHRGDGSVFEQFTGLTDKNGTDIFEGDRVKHNNNVFFVRYSSNRHVLVLRLENDKGQNWRELEWLGRVRKYVTVLGNIHQGSEVTNG